ncbi:MAG: 2-oxo acid dehydrogenase subunit E2 [Chloroflexi bacterium]|nr:2-oxo acid dehydrogenase subunit E2 [Chloroflexota bacterium]
MPSLTMPNIGEGVTEGEIVRWLKQLGDPIARDEPVVEIETDKAIVEIPSPFEGTLTSILVAEGETVPIGAAIAEITATGDEAPEAAAPEAAPSVPAPAPAEPPPSARPERPAGRYSPAVRRLAAEHGLDLSLVSGSGANGRVTRQDVLRFLEGAPPAEAAAPPSPPPPAAPAAAPPPGEGEPVRLSATRRAIARHMSEAHATIPVAWMAVEADVSGLVELRRRARDAFEEAHGLRLTFMPFFVQAIARTLREHPALNASYSEDGVLRHERLDMGIAVATDSGLLVPVLRAAGSKSLAELSRELQDLAERARARTLTREELVGATLTIDNTGAFGSLISQPIVPLGQVAIVTTEAIRRELRVVRGDDAFAVRSVMNLAISFDHRALDGAEAGAFMATLKTRLEAIGPDDPLDAGA